MPKIIISLTLLFLLAAVGLTFAEVIYVPDDYQTIQGAIDAAADGDTVIVRPGIYEENINFLGKAITLRSEQGPRVTVIDGSSAEYPDSGNVVLFINGESYDSLIEGFTITGGTGSNICGWMT